jgi:hypothetical protein
MIKSVRVLTTMLGKLGICDDIFVRDFSKQMAHGFRIPNGRPPIHYGLGLKESKDLVDRMLCERSRSIHASST